MTKQAVLRIGSYES